MQEKIHDSEPRQQMTMTVVVIIDAVAAAAMAPIKTRA